MSAAAWPANPAMTWDDRAPVCGCGQRLPNFAWNKVAIDDGNPSKFTIVAVTYHVECACGRTWDLQKSDRPPRDKAPR